jgi:ribosomal protein S5
VVVVSVFVRRWLSGIASGKVGVGVAKGSDVSDRYQEGVYSEAKKNMITISL